MQRPKPLIIGKKDPHFYAAVLNTNLLKYTQIELQARGGAITRLYHALIILQEEYNIPTRIEKTTLHKHTIFDKKTQKKTTIPEIHVIITPARKL